MRNALTFLFLVAAVCILVGITIPRIGGGERSRITVAHADIGGGIKTALDCYLADNDHYPGSLQDLVQKSSSATNWHGPYIEKIPVDPWSDPYIYEHPGRHNVDAYDLMSAGADGKPGTKDDIGNWTK